MTQRARVVRRASVLLAALRCAAWSGLAIGAEVTQIGIAATEKGNDYGWNQQGVQAARSAAKSAGLKVDVADGVGYENTESVLRRLAQGGSTNQVYKWDGFW